MEKTAFLFPGQGSQYIGMGKSFYDNYSIARQTFEEADDVLGFRLSDLIFEGSLVQLNRAENLQPALVTVSTAIYRCLMEENNIKPFFCAGHSLGEYSALTCAGAIRFPDAIRLTRQRGILTQNIIESDIGIMTILDQIDANKVKELCKKYEHSEQKVSISCYNTPNQVAISGCHDAVEYIEEEVLNLDGQITPLISSAPIHSSFMGEMSESFRAEVEKYKYYLLKCPVVANVTGTPYPHSGKIPDILTEQLVKPVKWEQTVRYLYQFGVTTAIEIGPKNTLRKMTEEIIPQMKGYCYGEKSDREELKQLFSGQTNAGRGISSIVTKCMAVAVSTPNKNEDQTEYQNSVVENYRRLEKIQADIEESGKSPAKEQLVESLELLKVILETKKVDTEEQREWFYHIIEDSGMIYELKDYIIPA